MRIGRSAARSARRNAASPDRRRAAAGARSLAAAAILMVLVGVATGWAIRGLDSTPFGDLDRGVSEWFVEQRRSPWVGLSRWLSVMGDFVGVVALTGVVAGAAAWRWRRAREAVFVGVALTVQVATYLLIASLVVRPRPDVTPLGHPPPTGAFPSGHTASAVVLWLSLVLLVFAGTARSVPRALGVGAAVLVPTMVAAARLLRGMHALTDVVAGALLGAAVIWFVMKVARRDGWSPGTAERT